MAVRLAVLAHRYRSDWDLTGAGLADAGERLGRWRSAVRRAGAGHRGGAVAGAGDGGGAVPGAGGGGGAVAGAGAAGAAAVADAGRVLAAVRERVADDLDAPGALAVVDGWAGRVLAAPALPPGSAAGAALVRDTVDALLGVAL
jgi:L-cysteine:1D-myo-inositol 2-amino-2-deoxy-alpha-D-glucopyranoside ligase